MTALNHERDIYVNTNVMQKTRVITNVMTIAERLKQARDELGLTQIQLAAKAAVTQSTIANIENGIRKRPRDLVNLAKALNVDPAWLESGKGIKFPTYPPTEAGIEHHTSDGPSSAYNIKQALEVLEKALVSLDMTGRERMAPMFESFARSPGAVIKNDITVLLENPDSIKSNQSYSQARIHKTR